MENYTSRLDVQIASLDAILTFCRNPDSAQFAQKTTLIPSLGKIYELYPKESVIVWRIAMAFAILAAITGEIALDVVNTNVHESLIDNYNYFEKAPTVQQQKLWMLAALLKWPRSARILHKSQKCMDFFKLLLENKDKQLKEQELLQKQKAEEEAQAKLKVYYKFISC